MTGSSSYPQRRHPPLAGYDYTTPGYYFITICTHARQALFGEVEDGAMQLNDAGAMIRQTWRDLARLHVGIRIDTEKVMPDHVHAIVVLEDDPKRTLSLSDVVHRFKSLTTKRYSQGVRDQGWPRFDTKVWQDHCYDRIIRDERELEEITLYITENAERWELRRRGTQ